MTNITKDQAEAAINITRVIADCIRDITASNSNGLGGIPSGHLYVHVQGTVSLATYTAILDVLKRAKLVEERGHLLVWVGPAAAQKGSK